MKEIKKQANKYIQDYVISFNGIRISCVMYYFTSQRSSVDEQGYDFCKRGNGRIPYALDVFLRDYLYSECLETKCLN